jgi:Putative serine esterase (DUF676)
MQLSKRQTLIFRKPGRQPFAIGVLIICSIGLAQAQIQPQAEITPGPRPVSTLTFSGPQRPTLQAGEGVVLGQLHRPDGSVIDPVRSERVDIKATPPARFLFQMDPATGSITVSTSRLTPPGDYSIEATFETTSGGNDTVAFELAVNTTAPVPYTGRVPVVLMNGFQGICPGTSEIGTFGHLSDDLSQQHIPSLFFDNCLEGALPIETLGQRLGQFINSLFYDNGQRVQQVDLIAHSMGGLIARSYLAGLQADGSLSPPLDTRIRKFVQIATPNFGSFLALNSGVQLSGITAGEVFNASDVTDLDIGSRVPISLPDLAGALGFVIQGLALFLPVAQHAEFCANSLRSVMHNAMVLEDSAELKDETFVP